MAKTLTPSPTPIRFGPLLTAISDKTRWRILNLLFDEPLTSTVVAKMLGINRPNATKHLNQLRRSGLVIRSYGNVYKLAPEFIVPGERTLDTGPVLLRLDRQPATS